MERTGSACARCHNAWCDCCRCCKENCEGFQKIMDLKGLVVYRHRERDRLNVSNKKKMSKTKIPKLVGEAISESKQHRDAQTEQDDKSIIIIHNTRDINVSPADYLPGFDINEVSCPRCRYIMARAKRLLASVTVLDKNDVRSVCDRCKAYAPCHICQSVIKKFETTRMKDDRKGRILPISRKEKILKEQKKQVRAYTDIRDETINEIPKNSFSAKEMYQSTELETFSRRDEERDTVKSADRMKKTPYRYGNVNETWRKDTNVLGIETTGMIRRSHSEESLPTSFTTIREHLSKKQFKYFFPQNIKKEVAQLVKTSTELIKETQDRMKSKADETIKRKQEKDPENKYAVKKAAIAGTLIPDVSSVSVLAGKRGYIDEGKEDVIQKSRRGAMMKEHGMGKEKSIHEGKGKGKTIRMEKEKRQKGQMETVRKVKGKKLLKDKVEGDRIVKSEEVLKRKGDRIRKVKGEKLLNEKGDRVRTVKSDKLLKKKGKRVTGAKGDKLLTEKGESVTTSFGEWIKTVTGKRLKESTEKPFQDFKSKKIDKVADKSQETKELQESEVKVISEQKSQISESSSDATDFKDEDVQTDTSIKSDVKDQRPRKAGKQAPLKQRVGKMGISTGESSEEVVIKKDVLTEEELKLLNKIIMKHDKVLVAGKKQRAARDIELKKIKQMAEKRAKRRERTSATYLDLRSNKTFTGNDAQNEDKVSPKQRRSKQLVQVKDIKFAKDENDDLILKMIRARAVKPIKEERRDIQSAPRLIIKKIRKKPSEILEVESEAASIIENLIDEPEIIVGTEIIQMKDRPPAPEPIIQLQPDLFKTAVKDIQQETAKEIEREPKSVESEAKRQGTFRYALSDRTFIDNGWTLLPTEKIVRKMDIYRLRPVKPEFDWFEHNKRKRIMHYKSGEKLAEFDENGRGRWYYKNGRLALNYYDCEEANAQQRYVIYSSGSPDERGRSRPVTVLAMFDYLGNGVVFDHQGKIRLKYNQTEGVVLDRSVGADSIWKWHSLNDPPELQQVMIDTQLSYKDPEILELESSKTDDPRPEDDQMIAIEYENYVKLKNKRIQKFKPFQIRMKAMKINEEFSLKILNQQNIYLTFREGSTVIKLNLGMVLDSNEIVDTGTANFGVVELNLEKFPARSDSLANLQKRLQKTCSSAGVRTRREQRIRPVLPDASADKLTAAASKPMRPPLMPSHRISSCTNLYYNTRLI